MSARVEVTSATAEQERRVANFTDGRRTMGFFGADRPPEAAMGCRSPGKFAGVLDGPQRGFHQEERKRGGKVAIYFEIFSRTAGNVISVSASGPGPRNSEKPKAGTDSA